MIKICAISDIHENKIKLPKCDVLAIAGDISNNGTPIWFEQIFLPYLLEQKFDMCLLVFGNHDDGIYMNDKWNIIEKKLPDNVKVLNNKSFKYKDLIFYGSPNCKYIPYFLNTFDEPTLKEIYSTIPKNTDVLITHSPAYGIGDTVAYQSYHLGSESLLEKIRQVKPSVHLFGHIHTGKKFSKNIETKFYNVSVLDEKYEPTFKPTIVRI